MERRTYGATMGTARRTPQEIKNRLSKIENRDTAENDSLHSSRQFYPPRAQQGANQSSLLKKRTISLSPIANA